MTEKRKLPIYRAYLGNYEDGIQAVSLVEFPAVQEDFVTMSAQRSSQDIRYSIQNEDRRIITGLLLSADTPIYRITPEQGEFYLVFEKETVRLAAERFLQYWNTHNVNLSHDDDTYVNGVNLFELYLKDSTRGIVPKGFEDVPDGSLFVSYKVLNDYVWEEIKKGSFKGFSIQGMFNIEPTSKYSDGEDEEFEAAMELIRKINYRLIANGKVVQD